MKKFFRILASVMCSAVIALPAFFALACDGSESADNGDKNPGTDTTLPDPADFVDYVSQLKLDWTSSTKKQEVTVKLFVDGDTTHFYPKANSQLTPYNPADFAETEGYIKARYLAINTPESTGKIEEWGKAASKFTRSKLEEENVDSIVIESDTSKWDIDSTGERYLLWIWYLPKGGQEYRNLNVEILQEGLAIGSSTANNIYGDTAMAALNQAKAYKLKVHSDELDPDFPYGLATPLTLKELRCHLAEHEGNKVQVSGTVVAHFNNSVYIEDYDPDTGVCFGMAVYYGFGANSALLEMLDIGNEVSLVGTVQYYEGGDSFQISGLKYNKFDKNDPDNSNLLSSGNAARFAEISVKDLVSGKIKVNFDHENDEGGTDIETVELAYGEAVMNTSVKVSNLKVIRTSTTQSGNSKGAISLTCQAPDGTQITVRTEVLTDENGNVIKEDFYKNKTITVRGIVDLFSGSYQVKCWRADYITILD